MKYFLLVFGISFLASSCGTVEPLGPTFQTQTLSSRATVDIIAGELKNVGNFSFRSTETIRNVEISGSFTIVEGEEELIELLILNASELQRLRNGDNFEPTYRSGRVRQGVFNVPLPRPDQYALMFDNRLSSSSMRVQFEIVRRFEVNANVSE